MLNKSFIDFLYSSHIRLGHELRVQITETIKKHKKIIVPKNIEDYSISKELSYAGLIDEYGIHPLVERIEYYEKEDNVLIYTNNGSVYLYYLSIDNLFTIASLINYVIDEHKE